MMKWIAISLGGLVGVSHIAMIGLLATREQHPSFNLPVGEHTAYTVMAGKDGYSINYRANDPRVLKINKNIKNKGGFLGLANETRHTTEEYVVGGHIHHGGPVSNHDTWIDRSGTDTKKQSAEYIECIKAIGGGESTGRVVGTSVGTAAAPALSGIPFVGWLAAGWVAMFGGNQGADVGGDMAKSMTEACDEFKQ